MVRATVLNREARYRHKSSYPGDSAVTTMKTNAMQDNDPVNHPSHYTSHQSGIEAIQVTEHLNFCIGNAIKYLWRCDHTGHAIEDLKKAAWYIQREIARREAIKS